MRQGRATYLEGRRIDDLLSGSAFARRRAPSRRVTTTLLRAGMEAALATAEGFYCPNELFTNAAKYQAPCSRHRRSAIWRTRRRMMTC